jgi:hypothetical protein
MKGIRLFTLAAALLLPSCLFGNFGSPLDTNLHETELGTKTGKSSFHSILWLVAWGDAGSKAAASEADIINLRHMDQRTLIILFGVYYRQTTIVYGD